MHWQRLYFSTWWFTWELSCCDSWGCNVWEQGVMWVMPEFRSIQQDGERRVSGARETHHTHFWVKSSRIRKMVQQMLFFKCRIHEVFLDCIQTVCSLEVCSMCTWVLLHLLGLMSDSSHTCIYCRIDLMKTKSYNLTLNLTQITFGVQCTEIIFQKAQSAGHTSKRQIVTCLTWSGLNTTIQYHTYFDMQNSDFVLLGKLPISNTDIYFISLYPFIYVVGLEVSHNTSEWNSFIIKHWVKFNCKCFVFRHWKKNIKQNY